MRYNALFLHSHNDKRVLSISRSIYVELKVIRISIRILSLIGALCALTAGFLLKNNAFYFTSLSLFLAFLGTFVKSQQANSDANIHVTQKGGAHSTNTQTISFGSKPGDSDK